MIFFLFNFVRFKKISLVTSSSFSRNFFLVCRQNQSALELTTPPLCIFFSHSRSPECQATNYLLNGEKAAFFGTAIGGAKFDVNCTAPLYAGTLKLKCQSASGEFAITKGECTREYGCMHVCCHNFFSFPMSLLTH